MHVSSGAAVATTTAAATDVILASALAGTERNVWITSGVAGTWSVDGGISWHFIAANAPIERLGIPIKSVQIKREGATDMTGVRASVW
jgi:hypothetical protein